jgi:hypothetical protein
MRKRKFDDTRHQLAVGKQAANGDNDASQRGPEGVAAQALPVHRNAFQATRQTLMLLSR